MPTLQRRLVVALGNEPTLRLRIWLGEANGIPAKSSEEGSSSCQLGCRSTIERILLRLLGWRTKTIRRAY
jgi:hypothetical protein